MDILAVRKILMEVECEGFGFTVHEDEACGACGMEPEMYLQVTAWRGDNVDRKAPKGWVRGRKWRLSRHMVRSEVVQTALKAILTFEEHEIRERFLYRGRAIFDPHYDIDQLWELRGRAGVLDERAPR